MTLRFHFVCDSDGPETAAQVVQPLRDFPTLVSCRIRLGRDPNPSLDNIAKDIALISMGYQAPSDYSPPKSSFRFLDLPHEIRAQILHYTDLVTPLCEVEWNPESKFQLRFSRDICHDWQRDGSIGLCDTTLFPACQFRNCHRHDGLQLMGCFCQRYHAAFSLTCRCWSDPAYLFLVCKGFRDDA